MKSLLLGLTEYFEFYNYERPHQSLSYKTPDRVYRSGKGGGARITDKFKKQSGSELTVKARVSEGINEVALSRSRIIKRMTVSIE